MGARTEPGAEAGKGRQSEYPAGAREGHGEHLLVLWVSVRCPQPSRRYGQDRAGG